LILPVALEDSKQGKTENLEDVNGMQWESNNSHARNGKKINNDRSEVKG
jgi:hypothetical protein